MRTDNLRAVLRNNERRPIQNRVKTNRNRGVKQINLVEQEQPAVTHGQRQGPVLEGHTPIFHHGQMPDKVSHFKAPVSGTLIHWPVSPCRHLFDGGRLAASGRASNVQRS